MFLSESASVCKDDACLKSYGMRQVQIETTLAIIDIVLDCDALDLGTKQLKDYELTMGSPTSANTIIILPVLSEGLDTPV